MDLITIGLVLNIVGAIFLYFFGIQGGSRSKDNDRVMLADIGFYLFVAGFILPLIHHYS